MNDDVLHRPKPWGYGLLIAALMLLPQCSVLLDFRECSSAQDCGLRNQCVENLCQSPPQVVVAAVIASDTVWRAGNTYVLEGIVTILPSTTLTIEPGTLIVGGRGSALVARKGALIQALGTREAPIVFTSAKPPGSRLAGDWGGVALLGGAPVNRDNATLNILTDEAEASFGGGDAGWNCGTLRYVRIEFAGGQVKGEEALNGLTLAGCGTQTTMEYVQVHFGADDGIEIFGGTLNARYLLITRAQDDGLDIDLGWRGNAQFVAVQQDAAGDNALEVDNLREAPDATPQTYFRLYNFTLYSPPDAPLGRGITFKAGAAGLLSHGIVQGPRQEAIDIFGKEAGARAMAQPPLIEVRDTLFFDIGAEGTSYFPVAGMPGEVDPETGMGDDDGGVDEAAFFRNEALSNVFGVDPGLANPGDFAAPNFVPSQAAAPRELPKPPPGFDLTAIYHGAFSPTGIPWTSQWTAFPSS